MSAKSSLPQRFNVLLVEDNDDDVLLTKHAFKRLPVEVDFQVARDGLESLELLRPDASGIAPPLPNIILLDLNMPRMDGRQFLAELKRDERLKIIPTVVLTTSAAEDDVSCAYRNHAGAYMVKPMDLREFARKTECFANFWLSNVAVLPN